MTETSSAAIVKVGVIGCGRIAQAFHLPALAGNAAVGVAALADPNTDNLDAALSKQSRNVGQIKTHEDWTEIDFSSLDGIVIAAPPEHHQAMAEAAFAGGCGVYVEKPLGLSVEDCQSVLKAWRAAGTVGMVGHNFRFSPIYRTLRDRLAGIEIGQLVSIRTMVASAPRQLPEWKTARATGGGAAPDLLVHHVDLVEWLTGQPITQVSASVGTVRSDGDSVAVHAVLQHGTPVTMTASASSTRADTMEFIGTEGTLIVDRYAGTTRFLSSADIGYSRKDRLLAGLGSVPGALRDIAGVMAPAPERSFGLALNEFIAALSPDAKVRHPQPDLAVGLRAVTIIEAVEDSAAAGEVVRV